MFCRQSNSAVTQLTLIVNFMWCYSFCWTRAHEFNSAPGDFVSSDLWSHWPKPSFQLSFRLVTAAFLLSKSAAVLTLALPVVELYVNELAFFFFCLAAFVPQNVSPMYIFETLICLHYSLVYYFEHLGCSHIFHYYYYWCCYEPVCNCLFVHCYLWVDNSK